MSKTPTKLKLKLWLLACISCLLLSAPSYPESSAVKLQVERFSLVDGKRDALNAIHDILVNDAGFIWLGSENGLIRFDGSKVETYKTTNSDISNDFVPSLAKDREGYIWLATHNGLDRFDPRTESFEEYEAPQDEASGNMSKFFTHVMVAQDNSVYAASFGGISIVSPDRQKIRRWRVSSRNAPLLSNKVRSVYEDSRGDFWIGYADAGISWFDQNTQTIKHFRPVPEDPSALPHGEVRNFGEDEVGNIWVGTWGGGLARFDPVSQTFTRFSLKDSEKHQVFTIIDDIFKDSLGRSWIATDKGGVFLFDAETSSFKQFQHDPFDDKTLLNSSVRSVTEDHFGNIWFVTFPGGLSRYHLSTDHFQRWRHHLLKEKSLSHNGILALDYGKNNKLWVGTEAGLNLIDLASGDISKYPIRQNRQLSPPAPAITAIAEGRDNDVWVGTWSGGLSRLNQKTGEFFHFRDQQGKSHFSSRNIWKIYIDSQARVWLATETEGLNLYKPETNSFEAFQHDERLPNSISGNYILDIVEDNTGYLWLATEAGVDRFNPNTGKTQTIKSLIEDRRIRQMIKSLLVHANGELWIGTQSNGIFVLSRDYHIQKVDTSLLPSSSISGLRQDEYGYVWASTTMGLVKINVKTKKNENIYTENDGVAGNISNRNASEKLPDGRIFFGTTNGLYSFNPKNMRTAYGPPKTKIVSLKTIGGKTDEGDTLSSIYRNLNENSLLEIPDHFRVLNVNFSNLNYAYSSETHFSYLLEGYDRYWTDLTGNGSAHYIDLPAGAYTFVLRAKHHDLKREDDMTSIRINVLPPWWQSRLAYALYIVFALILIAGLYKIVILRFLTEQLSQQVAERTEELKRANDSKTDFLANVSHELKTPLNAVIGFSGQLIKKYQDVLDDRGIHFATAINKNGKHLNAIINDLLDIAKLEAGKMDVNIMPVHIAPIIKFAIENNLQLAEDRGLTINPFIVCEVDMVPADEQRLLQILNNLISNAIKYTNTGAITISVVEQSKNKRDYCVINIEDTGKGISEEDQEKLFHRFQQVDKETKYLHGYGTGLGLSIVDELVQCHKGFVRCQSTLGEGSTFSVYLPLAP